MDARNFNLYGARAPVGIQKPAVFSPFKYLFLLICVPLPAWYWAGETMHRMELHYARSNPGDLQSLAHACKSAALIYCDIYPTVSFVHLLALLLCVLAVQFMLLVSSLPAWPRKWQKFILMRAAFFGGIGLSITLLLVIARGIVATLTIWFIAIVWWEADNLAVQLASIVGFIALLQVPAHAKAAWRLFSSYTSRRTGKEVSRDECVALWALIDRAGNELGVDGPGCLVLGIFPDCRLTFGKMTLDPTESIVQDSVLYLGATLASALDESQLEKLIEHALLRRRGRFGGWLPAVEDWIESSENFLKECKERRAQRELGIAAEPAILCWEGWLIIVRQMMLVFGEEHALAQKSGIEQRIDGNATEVRQLLEIASLVYRKDVFYLFVVNLTSGVRAPPVLAWFSKALAERRRLDHAITSNSHAYTNPLLERELILLEKEWLIKTGQASTPTDCWELRAA